MKKVTITTNESLVGNSLNTNFLPRGKISIVNIMITATSNNGFTAVPHQILHNSEISLEARITWQMFASNEGKKDWTHRLSCYAKLLGRHINAVRRYVKELISFGYLKRTPKTNGDFGYIYSIPDEYLPCKRQKGTNSATTNLTHTNLTHTNLVSHNNKDINNTDQNNIECDQEKKEKNKNTNTHTHTSNHFVIQEDSQEVINHPTEEYPPVIDSVSQQKPTKPIIKPEIQNKTPLPQRVVCLKDTCNNSTSQGDWIDPETGDYKTGFMAWAVKWAMGQPFQRPLTTGRNARIWVKQYFKNDSTRIKDLWEEYKAEFDHRAENAQVAMNNGCQLREEEKQQLGQMYVETHSTPQKGDISPLLPSDDVTPIEQQTSPNLPPATAQETKPPVNPPAKFMILTFTKTKVNLGDYKQWCNNPEIKAKFIQYLETNQLIDKQIEFERHNKHLPSIFAQEQQT